MHRIRKKKNHNALFKDVMAWAMNELVTLWSNSVYFH